MGDLVQLSDVSDVEYVQWLNDKTPWSLSRWGDGELRALLSENDKCWERLAKLSKAWRKGKTNKSGHHFPPELGEEIRRLLLSKPTHRLALGKRFADPEAKAPMLGMGRWTKKWLDDHQLGDLVWDDMDMIVRALYQYRFEPFVDAMRSRRVVMVGPRHLKEFKLFPVTHIECPRRNAFKALSHLFRHVTDYLAKAGEHTVVSISMGPASPILVEMLWTHCKREHTIIDLGSIWDPFVGDISRRYMERTELQEYVTKLLGQAE
jgi:hypothetical protein